MIQNNIKHFFALVRLALTGNMEQCLLTDDIDWNSLFRLARRHTLVGICFAGIKRMPKGCGPDNDLLLKWLAATEQIKRRNRVVNARAVELTRRFAEAGFQSVILKGCGVATLYDFPACQNDKVIKTENLSALRTPGDIDIWLPNRSRREIIDYLRATSNSRYLVYHNAEYPIYKDVAVEVHFTPSWFWNFCRNRRFQKFCKSHAGECVRNRIKIEYGEISVPTLSFNRIFILHHIYRHLFGEGIGMRQLIDYYFVLVNSFSTSGLHDKDKVDSYRIIKALGMSRFCGAVMWIMKAVFHIDQACLFCEPNEKEGRFLLSEIMQAGNFGHYDKRIKHHKNETALGRYMSHICRDFRFIRSYPGEVLWIPVWKVWHFLWRQQFK